MPIKNLCIKKNLVAVFNRDGSFFPLSLPQVASYRKKSFFTVSLIPKKERDIQKLPYDEYDKAFSFSYKVLDKKGGWWLIETKLRTENGYFKFTYKLINNQITPIKTELFSRFKEDIVILVFLIIATIIDVFALELISRCISKYKNV